MCVNKLSKVALDSAAAGIEPATSSRKSNVLTTLFTNTLVGHAYTMIHNLNNKHVVKKPTIMML